MTLDPRVMARVDLKTQRRGDGECWPWSGSVTGRGTPHMAYSKNTSGSPRRLVWERAFGAPPDAKRKVRMTCRNQVCMNPRHMWNPTLEERFWSKVNKDGPVPAHLPELGQCWVWTAGTYRRGYGDLYQDVDQDHLRAHRYSYELHFGPIPTDGEKLLVLHRCDNTACVRPEHLTIGTDKDNMQDMIAKGRAAWQKAKRAS